jgi:hypothetical protein
MTRSLLEIKGKIRNPGKRLSPPLSETDVAEFEAKHDITLPEPYRRFLLEVGNGGDGPPYYGLAPLGSGAASSYKPETEYWQQLPDVGKPFPFTKPWIWECGEVSDEGALSRFRMAAFSPVLMAAGWTGT